jgi:hypothetical protein
VTTEDPNGRLITIRDAVRQYLDGIDRTARVFPLGALHLGASLIDVLARLTCNGRDDQARYTRFVQDYLPPEYTHGDLPERIYQGLRNLGLHNLLIGPKLALMDGQMDRATHLKPDRDGRIIVRLEEFIGDLRSAVLKWERSLQQSEALRRLVVDRERRKPVFEIVMIEVPAPGQIWMSTATATTVAASAAVSPGSQVRRQTPY